MAHMSRLVYIGAMRFDELLGIVGDEPVFETGLLLAGVGDIQGVQRQLSVWVKAGRLIKLRRGLYAVAPPHRTRPPEPFTVSNRLVRPSYVSLESALHFHELIPDVPFGVTGITTGKQGSRETPIGRYVYHHVSADRFWGAELREVARGERALIARPEKALIDLLYLVPRSDDPAFVRQLRLQNTDVLDDRALEQMVGRFGSPKVARGINHVRTVVREDREGWAEV